MNGGEVGDPLGAAPRLAALRTAIAMRARDCDRDPDAVTLVAVSKTYSADEVWPTIAICGQTIFGENRVQEAKAKWPGLRARAAAELGKSLELHLIGPLQSNKAAEAVELFDVIETVDRDKIAQALAAAMAKVGKRPRLFIEVNTGAEPQKAGVGPRDADAFIARCRGDYGLAIEGLMCVPPAGEPASPHFALLKVIAERNGIQQLSMGMSGDWPLAVPLGATEVRVGSAIFGART
jgi:PLP dependent protein